MRRRHRLGKLELPDPALDTRRIDDQWDLEEDVPSSGAPVLSYRDTPTHALLHAWRWQRYYKADELSELFEPDVYRAMTAELAQRAPERRRGGLNMRIGSAFPSKYLKAADLQGRRVAVTIDRVELEDVDDGDHKPVLYFRGAERGLVLNRTNAAALTDHLGTDETDQWRGRRVVLFPTRVDFQGRRVDAIRIDPAEASSASSVPAPASSAVPSTAVPPAGTSDEPLLAAPAFAPSDPIPF